MLVDIYPQIKFDGEMMIHLNILHTIITHFFQQFDLADNVALGDDPNWRWQDEGKIEKASRSCLCRL